MENSFKEKIRLAKSFNQNTVIRNGKLGRIFENTRIIAPEENCLLTLKLIQTLTITERGGNLPQKQLSEYLSEVSYHSTIIQFVFRLL